MKKIALSMVIALTIASCASEESQNVSQDSQADKTEQVEQTQAEGPRQEKQGEEVTAQAGDPTKGEQLFKQYCSACHGQDAKGIEGVGTSLVNNEFIRNRNIPELVQFVIEGRPANHPDNKTGIPMPPKGGFDFLTDEEITDIVAYLKTLEGNS